MHVTGIAAGDFGTRRPDGPSLSGVAPRAYIGNYKVLSAPDPGGGLNGNSPELIAGIEAAVADGMDVINMSLGEREIEPRRDLVAKALDAAADRRRRPCRSRRKRLRRRRSRLGRSRPRPRRRRSPSPPPT